MRVERFQGSEKSAAAYLVFNEATHEAILINPTVAVDPLAEALRKASSTLTAILFHRPDLFCACHAAEIQSRFKSVIIAPQEHILRLQRMPVEAGRAGVCGVKVPRIDHFVSAGDHVAFAGIDMEIRKIEETWAFRLGTGWFVDLDPEKLIHINVIAPFLTSGNRVYPSTDFPFDVKELSPKKN